jgi:hypothetical protein
LHVSRLEFKLQHAQCLQLVPDSLTAMQAVQSHLNARLVNVAKMQRQFDNTLINQDLEREFPWVDNPRVGLLSRVFA